MSGTKCFAGTENHYEDDLGRSRQHAAAGRAMPAMEQARHAVGLDPSRPEAFNLLGVCCELCRDQLAAQKYYRAALALDPAYEPAQRNLHRLVSYHKRGGVDLGAVPTIMVEPKNRMPAPDEVDNAHFQAIVYEERPPSPAADERHPATPR